MMGSNHRMSESKSDALPLGESPTNMASRQGFEPRPTVLETVMLPLTPARYKYGGGKRDRTDDPLLAKQVLSQLSYTPKLLTHS